MKSRTMLLRQTYGTQTFEIEGGNQDTSNIVIYTIYLHNYSQIRY